MCRVALLQFSSFLYIVLSVLVYRDVLRLRAFGATLSQLFFFLVLTIPLCRLEECLDVLFCSKLSCEPLLLPGYKEGVIIQPGLFKGTYGDHGLEIVLLTYEDNDSTAVITKITVRITSYPVLAQT